MVKFLVCGDVHGEWDILIARIQSLERSPHGPFDFMLIVGSLFKDKDEFDRITPTLEIPIATYALDRTGVSDGSKFPKNLHFLNMSENSLTIFNLTIFYLANNLNRTEEDLTSVVKNICNKPGYQGCDILITSEWPKDIHYFLEDNDFEILKAAVGSNMSVGSCKSAATFAADLKPRYHFSASKGCFYQRPPYRNYLNLNSDQPQPFTRFIGLGKVSNSKDKDKKWLHALSLEPLKNIDRDEFSTTPAGTTDCPYAEVGRAVNAQYEQRNKKQKITIENNNSNQYDSYAPAGAGAFFFGDTAARQNRAGQLANPTSNLHMVPSSQEAKRLFVAGFPRDISNSDLLSHFADATKISRAANSEKNFAFIEFSSPEAARAVMEGSAVQPILVGGRSVRLGWAKEEQRIQTIPSDAECRRLFVGGVPVTATAEELRALFSSALLRLLPEVDTDDGAVVTITRPAEKDFAFVEFQRPEYAAAVLQDGLSLGQQPLTLGWAKQVARPAAQPPADCWFCLASPSAKLHLVVSVGEHSYMALPRGGLVPYHAMLTPIACLPSRLLLDEDTQAELSRYEDCVEAFHESQGCATVLFERTVRPTAQSAGTHMQRHAVPVPFAALPAALATLQRTADSYGIRLLDLKDASVEELLQTAAGGPCHQYFYLRLPQQERAGGAISHRHFLYMHTEASFPMIFGLQVVANILNKPERSSWKNCLLAEADELRLVDRFKENFAPFDFTLNN